MEKKNKIIIKLFEEFKEDNIFVKQDIINILNNFITNESNKKVENNRIIVNKWYLDVSSNFEDQERNDGDFYNTFDINPVIADEYSLFIKCNFNFSGGELIADETDLNPAEYNDENVELTDIIEVHYYNDAKQIDTDVNLDEELTQKIKEFVNLYNEL